MRRLTSILTILATAVAFGSASAAFNRNNLSLNFTAGEAVNMSSGARGDLFPNGFAASADMLYRLNDHVSLMPVSLLWHNYSYRQHDNMVTQNVVNNLPADVSKDPEQELNIRANASGVGYLPGLRLESAGDRMFNVFGQVGLGVYRYDETFKVFNIDQSMNETSFATRVAAGIDYKVADRADAQLSTGYFHTNTNQARSNLIDFNLGVRYLF